MTATTATLVALASLSGGAQAQTFPAKPVRVIVPFAPGNTLDASLRQVGEVFQRNTGQPIVIDNRPGGAGIVAAQALLQSPPDGYTLLLTNTSMLTINPHTFSKLPYDTEKSFKHVTNFLGATMVFAVNAANVPPNTMAEFIAWAKPQGPKISYASFTAGNSSHFAGVILNRRTGTELTHVPFNGTPPAVQNLVGGQVHAAILPLLAVKPHMESGKVKVLAVTSPQRSPHMPGVPSFTELGLPEMEIFIWSSLAVPAGTPDTVVTRLNEEFVKALRTEEIREKWRQVDFTPLPTTPQEVSRFVQAESARWAEAVKISGFKVQD
ncbi:MAG: tripartite tricarboxylate transporter substrate binding protein [Betaproteobacteria bacterium]